MGRQVVGNYDLWRKRWRVRRPFRLFVDEPAYTEAAVSLHARRQRGAEVSGES